VCGQLCGLGVLTAHPPFLLLPVWPRGEGLPPLERTFRKFWIVLSCLEWASWPGLVMSAALRDRESS